jgi:hypothetical protein
MVFGQAINRKDRTKQLTAKITKNAENGREWGISSMEVLHAKDAKGEIDRKMTG